MDAPTETTRHTCGHCQQECLTTNGRTPFEHSGKMKWRQPLRHSPEAVMEAAFSGCPFFVWLWDQLKGSKTPPEQMRRTAIVFELEAVRLETIPAVDLVDDHDPRSRSGIAERVTYEIVGCTVNIETVSYAWTPAKFTVMSDWDDPSAHGALARTIDGHTSSSQAIAQVQRRLQYCRTHHLSCKAVSGEIRPCRFILVDQSSGQNPYVKVVRAKSLENGDTEPYAALSYCWGHDQVFKTTLANKAEVENGIPLSLLSKTIKDAIHLTSKLQIRLLWVDSLCLVQDNQHETAQEIAQMQHYYGNSSITISAATAKSCSEGFLQDKPMPITSKDDMLGPFYFPFDLEISERPAWLKLVTRERPVEAIDSRAWTLQEGLLSRRLVSFGSHVIRWSCRSESYEECGQSDFRLSLREYHSETASTCAPTWKNIKFWCTLVENYTSRTLSDEQDRLPAISGIASIFSQKASLYVAGLIDWGLSPTTEQRHRAERLGVDSRPALLPFQLLWTSLTEDRSQARQPGSPDYIAPSWSWASHCGAVETPFTRIEESLLFDLKLATKVLKVAIEPKSFQEPYGALEWGAITLEGPIFFPTPNKVARIFWDNVPEGGMEPQNWIMSGLLCLQVIPNVQLQEKQASQLHRIPHGIVLQHRWRGSNDYRRVGTYESTYYHTFPDRSETLEASETQLPRRQNPRSSHDGQLKTITIM